uniref:Uncharacterized protein n=1 Tax=Ascaris lumbricoides TaxID=6252 RepID=A0A0M3IIH8_ASCLU
MKEFVPFSIPFVLHPLQHNGFPLKSEIYESFLFPFHLILHLF